MQENEEEQENKNSSRMKRWRMRSCMRSPTRRNLTSLSHMDYEELKARPASTHVASAMTIADVSPRLALQVIFMAPDS